MILGTGIDLLKISRVEKVLNKYGNIFIKKILSNDEIKKNKKQLYQANKLAKSFATKEAFVKAVGTGFNKEISFKDISLKSEKNGKPFIDLSERVKSFLKTKTPNGYTTKINVTISDERDYVISNVIISLQKK